MVSVRFTDGRKMETTVSGHYVSETEITTRHIPHVRIHDTRPQRRPRRAIGASGRASGEVYVQIGYDTSVSVPRPRPPRRQAAAAGAMRSVPWLPGARRRSRRRGSRHSSTTPRAHRLRTKGTAQDNPKGGRGSVTVGGYSWTMTTRVQTAVRSGRCAMQARRKTGAHIGRGSPLRYRPPASDRLSPPQLALGSMPVELPICSVRP